MIVYYVYIYRLVDFYPRLVDLVKVTDIWSILPKSATFSVSLRRVGISSHPYHPGWCKTSGGGVKFVKVVVKFLFV